MRIAAALFAVLLSGLLLSGASPAAEIFSDDFEDGDLAGWTQTPAGHWTNSTTAPISGTRSLKHGLTDALGGSAAAAQITMDVNTDLTSWRFSLKNGGWDPSANNRFHVFLMANESDLQGATVDGYALGVDPPGTEDYVRLWRVTDGAPAAQVAASAVDWGSGDSMGIQVRRSAAGEWEIRLDRDGGFDNLAWEGWGTDATYADASYFGLAFNYTSNRAGSLWMDDVRIEQGGAGGGPPELLLSPAGTSRSGQTGNEIAFDVVAVEPLGDYADTINLWVTNPPPGAVFPPSSGTHPLTNTFSWTPAAAGVTSIVFHASDGDGAVTLAVTLTVSELDPGKVWINELHYDNTGTDTNEGVELAGPAGTSLNNYWLERYNGSNGGSYGTKNLSGVIDNEDGRYGAAWFGWSGLQNGPSEGLALFRVEAGTTSLLQFISYEGEFEAVDGVAAGLFSVDIGVSEPDTTPTNMTLQLTGVGKVYTDFTWEGPRLESRGRLNEGQTILGEPTVLMVR